MKSSHINWFHMFLFNFNFFDENVCLVLPDHFHCSLHHQYHDPGEADWDYYHCLIHSK